MSDVNEILNFCPAFCSGFVDNIMTRINVQWCVRHICCFFTLIQGQLTTIFKSQIRKHLRLDRFLNIVQSLTETNVDFDSKPYISFVRQYVGHMVLILITKRYWYRISDVSSFRIVEVDVWWSNPIRTVCIFWDVANFSD